MQCVNVGPYFVFVNPYYLNPYYTEAGHETVWNVQLCGNTAIVTLPNITSDGNFKYGVSQHMEDNLHAPLKTPQNTFPFPCGDKATNITYKYLDFVRIPTSFFLKICSS